MSAVVLFDGVCNFCDASVNFVIERDGEGYFKFAPLQSDAGMKLAAQHGLNSKLSHVDAGDGSVPIDSVILIEDGKSYIHSTAALRIARHLGPPWSWLYVFIVVPTAIRDLVYKLFAKYRYKIFGRKDECMLPSAEVRARFL